MVKIYITYRLIKAHHGLLQALPAILSFHSNLEAFLDLENSNQPATYRPGLSLSFLHVLMSYLANNFFKIQKFRFWTNHSEYKLFFT